MRMEYHRHASARLASFCSVLMHNSTQQYQRPCDYSSTRSLDLRLPDHYCAQRSARWPIEEHGMILDSSLAILWHFIDALCSSRDGTTLCSRLRELDREYHRETSQERSMSWQRFQRS